MNLKIALSLCVLCFFVIIACGQAATGLCDSPSSCTSDPVKTTDAITKCERSIDAGTSCSAETRVSLTCARANQVCASTGKTDEAATSMKCQTENAALVRCVLNGSSDGGM